MNDDDDHIICQRISGRSVRAIAEARRTTVARSRGDDYTVRALTAYGFGVVMVFAILNGIGWLLGSPLCLHRDEQ
jgi:hypothetical protein